MMRAPIGYYVHHHGAGHLERAKSIAKTCSWPIILMGSGIGDLGLDLPDDRMASGAFDGDDGNGSQDIKPQCLHYAPLHHDGIRRRTAMIAQWIADQKPVLMVADVSVEIAMLARLASVPTIYVRLNGERIDPPHVEAFRGASALLAPFSAELETLSTPQWIRDKSFYFPSIAAPSSMQSAIPNRLLIVVGRGGDAADGAMLARAAAATPQWQWRVIGPVSAPHHLPDNLTLAGWVDDAETEMAKASILMGAAGNGFISAAMAADRPLICIAESRPFAEQISTATRLKALGAALVLDRWPEAEAWPALLEKAENMNAQARRNLHDPNGTQKISQWLAMQAEYFARERRDEFA